jgi:hypothetical protein
VKDLYEKQKVLISEEEMGYERYDRLRYGHDLLLYKVTEYVIATKRQTYLWI